METDDEPDDGENKGGGDRPTDKEPEQKASFSSDADATGWKPHVGAKSEQDWMKRAEELVQQHHTTMFEMTEKLYISGGEASAHIETTLPWKKRGMTKKAWIESVHNPMRKTCGSSTQWNYLLLLYEKRDLWEPAKKTYRERNDDWEPEHKSSPLWGLDIIKKHVKRDLDEPEKVKAPPKIKGSVWQQRFYVAHDELKRVAAIHDYESTVLKTLDEQVAKDPVAEPVVLASTEDVEKRMARANVIRAMISGDKSESREAMERMLDELEASMERFEMVGIEARPVSNDFMPSATEMASKLRLLREAELRAAAEKGDAVSQQKAGFSSSPPVVEVPPEVETLPAPVTGDGPAKRRPGRKPNPITSIKQLRIVAAKAIKDDLAQPDLTLARLKAKLDPVWNSLDADNFEGGEPMTAFRRFVWDRLRSKAKEQGFPLDGLDWHDKSEFEIVESDHGDDDPDDDPPKGSRSGRPATPPQDSPDGGEAVSAPVDTNPDDRPSDTGAKRGRAITKKSQLINAVKRAVTTQIDGRDAERHLPEMACASVKAILEPIWARVDRPNFEGDFTRASNRAQGWIHPSAVNRCSQRADFSDEMYRCAIFYDKCGTGHLLIWTEADGFVVHSPMSAEARAKAKAIQNLRQLQESLAPVIQILRETPSLNAVRVKEVYDPISRQTHPDLFPDFLRLAKLEDMSIGEPPSFSKLKDPRKFCPSVWPFDHGSVRAAITAV